MKTFFKSSYDEQIKTNTIVLINKTRHILNFVGLDYVDYGETVKTSPIELPIGSYIVKNQYNETIGKLTVK